MYRKLYLKVLILSKLYKTFYISPKQKLTNVSTER